MHSRLESRLEATNQLLADAALGRSRGDSVRGMTWRAICVRPCWWDFPGSVEQYMHRVGRAGRSGRKGASMSFFTRNMVGRCRLKPVFASTE